MEQQPGCQRSLARARAREGWTLLLHVPDSGQVPEYNTVLLTSGLSGTAGVVTPADLPRRPPSRGWCNGPGLPPVYTTRVHHPGYTYHRVHFPGTPLICSTEDASWITSWLVCARRRLDHQPASLDASCVLPCPTLPRLPCPVHYPALPCPGYPALVYTSYPVLSTLPWCTLPTLPCTTLLYPALCTTLYSGQPGPGFKEEAPRETARDHARLDTARWATMPDSPLLVQASQASRRLPGLSGGSQTRETVGDHADLERRLAANCLSEVVIPAKNRPDSVFCAKLKKVKNRGIGRKRKKAREGGIPGKQARARMHLNRLSPGPESGVRDDSGDSEQKSRR